VSGVTRLEAHLAQGATTVCRAWAVTRRDGVVLGFTDHDRDLSFDGISFRADSGLTARALQQTSGLAVDNSEALGVLSAAAVTEEDLIAGRFDGADVRAWLVNWADVAVRQLLFRGTLGEVVRSGGAFRAELRGLSEGLNQPQGRAYQKTCSAILGDRACRFDLATPGYSWEGAIGAIADGRMFRLPGAEMQAAGFFDRGRLRVLSGAAAGLVGLIKRDTLGTGERTVELWDRLGVMPLTGDLVRIEAGCDRLASTCKEKFRNFINFQGFPHVPGEDWLISYPTGGSTNDGGSLSS